MLFVSFCNSLDQNFNYKYILGDVATEAQLAI